ncbi:hypothetical protein JST97_24095 [bacterium]|nr:hypothetical protein [bacterium]
MDALPIGSQDFDQAPARNHPLVTAYLVAAGIIIPAACVLVESLGHPCRKGCQIDPIQHPWQTISVLAVSITHLLVLKGVRGPKVWPMLAWALLICCGYTVWFAPAAPLGFWAGPKGLLMFGPLVALVSTLLLIPRCGLPKTVFWLSCLLGYSCLAYSLKLSCNTIFNGVP